MANISNSVYAAVMAMAGFGLSVGVGVGVAIASALRRAVSTCLVGSIWPASASRLPLMGQQLFDTAVQLRGQPGQHVLEVGPRLVPIEFGRLQQAHHDCGPLACQLAADEQPIAPTQGPRPDPVLDVVVVDRHIAVHRNLPRPAQWFTL